MLQLWNDEVKFNNTTYTKGVKYNNVNYTKIKFNGVYKEFKSIDWNSDNGIKKKLFNSNHPTYTSTVLYYKYPAPSSLAFTLANDINVDEIIPVIIKTDQKYYLREWGYQTVKKGGGKIYNTSYNKTVQWTSDNKLVFSGIYNDLVGFTIKENVPTKQKEDWEIKLDNLFRGGVNV